MIIFFSFIIITASEIHDVYSVGSGLTTPNVSGSPSRNSPSPTDQNNSVCDWRKVNSGAPDAHEACHMRCLAAKRQIGAYHTAYPDHMIVTRFYNKCGLVVKGECDYWGTEHYPICLCYTPSGIHGRLEIPLWMCRLAGTVLYKITGDLEKGIGEKDETYNLEKSILAPIYTEEKEESVEENGEKSGEVLIVDLKVLGVGINVKALIDTGSSVTLIHPKLAGKRVWPLEENKEYRIANNKKLQIFGSTLVYVQTEEGKTFSVRGLVTNHHFQMILGNDFNYEHATKINILRKSMTVLYYDKEIKMGIKFVNVKDFLPTVDMMCCWCSCLSDVRKPLSVSGWVNRYKSKIMIDTGVSRSIVKKSYVKNRNIRETKHTFLITPNNKCDAGGETDIEVFLGKQKFSTPALIMKFQLPYSLVMGNTFIKPYVELIDFGQKTVTLAPFDSNGRNVIKMIGN